LQKKHSTIAIVADLSSASMLSEETTTVLREISLTHRFYGITFVVCADKNMVAHEDPKWQTIF
jgi:hypothetical protein